MPALVDNLRGNSRPHVMKRGKRKETGGAKKSNFLLGMRALGNPCARSLPLRDLQVHPWGTYKFLFTLFELLSEAGSSAKNLWFLGVERDVEICSEDRRVWGGPYSSYIRWKCRSYDQDKGFSKSHHSLRFVKGTIRCYFPWCFSLDNSYVSNVRVSRRSTCKAFPFLVLVSVRIHDL